MGFKFIYSSCQNADSPFLLDLVHKDIFMGVSTYLHGRTSEVTLKVLCLKMSPLAWI